MSDESGPAVLEATTVLSAKRQLTVPAAMARKLDLEPGTRLLLRVEGGHIVVLPLKSSRLTDLVGGSLRGAYGDPDTYVREERASWADE